jgi:DNA-binding CsgD family transcriptional regulator
LKGSEKVMQAVLNGVNEAVIVVNRHGAVRVVNWTAAQQFDTAPEAIVGTLATELESRFIVPGMPESRLWCIREVVRSGRPIRVQDERSGIVFTTTYHPVCNTQGRISHVAIFGWDITGRERDRPWIARDDVRSAAYETLRPTGRPVAETGPLTAAESQVLRLILEGKSNKEIAALLCRSERTVEVHRSHVMGKLHVHNVVDLVKQTSLLGLSDTGQTD